MAQVIWMAVALEEVDEIAEHIAQDTQRLRHASRKDCLVPRSDWKPPLKWALGSLETPAFRVSPQYSGPLPWKESKETGWFRADGDPQPAIAVSYYSIPEEFRPSNY